MKITYIKHSGYLLESDQALLLFDFWKGTLPPLAPEKDLFVFVSHRHEDHFNPKIFNLAVSHPKIHFILSDDIWQNKVPEHLHGLTCLWIPERSGSLKKAAVSALLHLSLPMKGLLLLWKPGFFLPAPIRARILD